MLSTTLHIAEAEAKKPFHPHVNCQSHSALTFTYMASIMCKSASNVESARISGFSPTPRGSRLSEYE